MNKEAFNGFYKKSISERQEIVAKEFALTPQEKALLEKEGPLSFEIANRLVENVIGAYALPMGLANNFVIDGKEYIIPFVLEEPSVVAASCNAAKLSKGFTASADEPIMIGQLQIVNLKNATSAKKKILDSKKDLLDALKNVDPVLVRFGGGPVDIKCEVLKTKRGEMIEVQLLVNVGDAMGANAINTMAEKITPKLEELSGGEVRLRIISNLAIYRKARAKTTWAKESLKESTKGEMSGEEVVERILDAYEFAVSTPFRTATHNKGIMNGIDAVVIATGNDWRAIEAGAHAFACYEKEYSPLTKYYKDEKGNLVGEIELPLALGLVGGATKIIPLAQLSLKILGVKKSSELARVIASVGLAQNFGALRALATTGIQAGHMKLHSKNIAVQAGAKGAEIDIVSAKMVEAKEVNQTHAEIILKEIRAKN
ncbi:MAG: hydroxymethylglutaryl-CoA reductase, degradative [archaeon]